MTRHQRWWCVAIGGSVSLLLAPRATADTTVSHGIWDQLLRRYVQGGLVDYRGLRSEHLTLAGYLVNLREVHLAQLGSPEERLAFWLNAYNACVVQCVLDRYPVTSVREIPGFFDKIRYRVGGRNLTLNEIEAQVRAFGDWRVHFALVCASRSCPLLRAEAYDPERLEEQLVAQVTAFLQDNQQALRIEGGTLRVSKLFDWYATDFFPAARLGLLRKLKPALLKAVLEPYLEPSTTQMIGWLPQTPVKFLDYDWSLNEQL